MKNIFVFSLLLLPFVFSQLPVSKEAKLVEVVSSSEVMVEATGIYNGVGKKDKHKKKDVDKKGLEGATLDARKSALYFVLFGGTDPLISSPEERQNFNQHEANYFGDNLNGCIHSPESTVRATIDFFRLHSLFFGDGGASGGLCHHVCCAFADARCQSGED